MSLRVFHRNQPFLQPCKHGLRLVDSFHVTLFRRLICAALFRLCHSKLGAFQCNGHRKRWPRSLLECHFHFLQPLLLRERLLELERGGISCLEGRLPNQAVQNRIHRYLRLAWPQAQYLEYLGLHQLFQSWPPHMGLVHLVNCESLPSYRVTIHHPRQLRQSCHGKPIEANRLHLSSPE